VSCILGPVKALPMRDCTIKNPTVIVNGKTIVFPIRMRSGSYLEFYGNDDCILYGAKGEKLMKVIPEKSVPLLLKGKNQIQFCCDQIEGPAPRVKVTVISYGESL